MTRHGLIESVETGPCIICTEDCDFFAVDFDAWVHPGGCYDELQQRYRQVRAFIKTDGG